MSSDIESIKLSKSITVRKYRSLEGREAKDKIADFTYERFNERYIRPLKTEDVSKNKGVSGFAIMALCCLMIEALESFYSGYEDTKGESRKCFMDFFERASQFEAFKNEGENFYKNVRCGILHQAETTGGWLITRKKEAPLFNSACLTVNAVEFRSALENYLKEYKQQLKKSDWDDDIWKNYRKKMASIINNCKNGVKDVR